jgi:hypothetical protein
MRKRLSNWYLCLIPFIGILYVIYHMTCKNCEFYPEDTYNTGYYIGNIYVFIASSLIQGLSIVLLSIM